MDANEILMPALSPTMEEGGIAKWLVKPGDNVKAGDVIAETETDKAIMEFEATSDCTIKNLLVAEGTTEIYNAAIARKKECDRIRAITTELKKMGADIEEKEDGLIVKTSSLTGVSVQTYHDHRMVMSLSVAALGAKGETLIQNVECVKKTYPNFAEHFQFLGADLKEER